MISYLCHHCYVDTARAFAQDSRPISIDASNGLESGFGHREADRDLTGAPLHRDETSRTANPEIVTVPIQEDIIPHLETVLPPLKDSDGDEVMAPPVTDELDQRVGTPQHIDEGHDARMSLDVERSSTQQDDIEVDAELADNIGMERERGDHVGMEADVQVESTTIPPPANLLAGEDGEDILREVGLRKGTCVFFYYVSDDAQDFVAMICRYTRPHFMGPNPTSDRRLECTFPQCFERTVDCRRRFTTDWVDLPPDHSTLFSHAARYRRFL